MLKRFHVWLYRPHSTTPYRVYQTKAKSLEEARNCVVGILLQRGMNPGYEPANRNPIRITVRNHTIYVVDATDLHHDTVAIDIALLQIATLLPDPERVEK